MSHIQKVSSARVALVDSEKHSHWAVESLPVVAGAKEDFLNALQRAWQDFLIAKRNEL